MKKLSDLYDISSRGNLRNEVSKGFIRPTLKQVLSPYKKYFNNIEPQQEFLKYTIGQCEGGIPSAKSVNPSYPVENAFNKSTSPYISNAHTFPAWIQYDFGANNKKVITYILLQSYVGGNPPYMPKDFTIQASNDGVNWDTILVKENEPNWVSVESREYKFENITSYQIYRLNVTDTETPSGDIVIRNIEMRESVFGSVFVTPFTNFTIDQCEGGTPFADSVNYNSSPTMAFNNTFNDNYSLWISKLLYQPHWLGYQFITPKKISRYKIKAPVNSDYLSAAPRDWYFQASNDNVNWTTLDTQSLQTWSVGETKTFDINNNIQYTYYRIYIFTNQLCINNEAYVQEVEMMEGIS